MDQDSKNNNEGIDLSRALEGSGTSVIPNKDEKHRVARPYHPGRSKMAQWVIRYSGGLVRNEMQANYVLLSFTVLMVFISVLLVFGGGTDVHIEETLTPPAEGPIENFIVPPT